MQRTLEQVRNEGLAALAKHLGRADTIRFIQLFEGGSGDYATERHEWVDKTTFEDIEKAAESLRRSVG